MNEQEFKNYMTAGGAKPINAYFSLPNNSAGWNKSAGWENLEN